MASDAELSAWQASQISPPDRAPSFVLNLERMPRGMIVQILNDIPIVRVLQILCYGTQSLKDSVFNNPNYKDFWISPTKAAPIVEWFSLYGDVCWFKRRRLSSPDFFISNTPQYAMQTWGFHGSRRSLLQKVREELIIKILNECELTLEEQKLLYPYSTEPCPELFAESFGSLKARWDWIKQTKFALNLAKALQINKVANIVATPTGRLRLKKPLDPSQDGPRPNTRHIINGFRGASKRVLKDRKSYHKNSSLCCKGVDCIEVVPYDKYLWLFLDMIKKYPPANEGHDNEYQVKDGEYLIDHGAYLMDQLSLAEMYQYPEPISSGIKVINRGLINVYTGSPLLIVPRIDWYPPGWSTGASRPIFYVETKPHSPGLPEGLHRCPFRKIMTYDEREYEWLTAFLEVVTWMEDNLE